MPESTVSPTPSNAVSDQRQHNPVSFWLLLRGDGNRSAQVEVLQQRNKSAVYRLIRARPNSEPVIAKRCRRRIARIEQFIQLIICHDRAKLLASAAT